ncbi:hypothetical protein DPMN_049991 [Dreissena polymorpha]|uniref:Uncharacterized protein n=1 Tax=Dreissena polymorpha TaxID=45954 RepID=A0A9D4HMN2_DREPO|nr:hypothetical protein DPMN_049991 [Dreissena polymorpha]
MDENQRRQVANLLVKHASTFSETDYDIGRTGIVRHKITTGDAQPIKQSLRRPLFHINEKIDSQMSWTCFKKGLFKNRPVLGLVTL